MHTASAVLRQQTILYSVPASTLFLMHTASAVLRQLNTFPGGAGQVPYAHRFGKELCNSRRSKKYDAMGKEKQCGEPFPKRKQFPALLIISHDSARTLRQMRNGL